MSITNTTKTVSANPGEFLAEQIATGRAIENSEERGQRELVASDVLPARIQGQELFERLGFRFGELVDGDPLFRHAFLPAGWKRAPTDHPMWSEIQDGHGRPRVMVFYKAAFYDRNAHAHLVSRLQMNRRDDGVWVVTDNALRKEAYVGGKSDGAGPDGYDGCQKYLREAEQAGLLSQEWPEPA